MSDQLGAGDVAIIAGGGRGIGKAIAEELAQRGVACVIFDAPPRPPVTATPAVLDAEGLAAATRDLQSLSPNSTGFDVDVRDREAVARAVAEATASVGPPTVLVIAASVFSHTDAATMSDEQWDDVVDTNLHGGYNVAREVVPGMVERGKGRVLFVSGDEARRGVAGLSHVAAASWAVIGLAKSIALETAPANVAVNVLCTGPVHGPVTDSEAYRGLIGANTEEVLATKHPNNEAWVPVGDVVDAAIFLLGRRGTSMSGSVVDVSNGMSALNTA